MGTRLHIIAQTVDLPDSLGKQALKSRISTPECRSQLWFKLILKGTTDLGGAGPEALAVLAQHQAEADVADARERG